jgi:hypothetical protein
MSRMPFCITIDPFFGLLMILSFGESPAACGHCELAGAVRRAN